MRLLLVEDNERLAETTKHKRCCNSRAENTDQTISSHGSFSLIRNSSKFLLSGLFAALDKGLTLQFPDNVKNISVI